ncbi:hypothetical protein PL321_10575 [Caloramator sp. mosi_1]|uniref:hypothetical protein n=1 Tax=Caloramator sp. mosi_1 TaxID=3023090 RepID=UPI0023628528|nr:hypothetical protein [Caloramator sp. mosi_1]WDC83235.1 hypothetical protein PL321_10575 [Caloramator sp. mosi_1]
MEPRNIKRLLHYFNLTEYDKCIALYKVFAKGINPKETKEQEVYSGFDERVKSNISIISKRQILTK